MQHHDWRSLLRAAGLVRRAQGVSSPASHRATPFSHDGYLRLGRSRLGSSLARSVCLSKKVMSQGWYQWSFCWYHKKTKPRPAWYQNRNKTTRPGLLVLNLGFIPWSDTSRSLCSFPSHRPIPRGHRPCARTQRSPNALVDRQIGRNAHCSRPRSHKTAPKTHRNRVDPGSKPRLALE